MALPGKYEVDQILDKQSQTVRIGQSKLYELNGADVKIVVNGIRAKCLIKTLGVKAFAVFFQCYL